MHRKLSRLLTVLGAFAAGAAGAAQHHICYQGDYVNGQPTAIWGCHDDTGGGCSISAPGTTVADYIPGGAQGTFKQTALPQSGSYTGVMKFPGANVVRYCQVNTTYIGGTVRGPASPGAVLTGFATDASGMVTTGVWRLQSPTPARWNTVTVEVPADFVAVGGGAMGQESPYGALVVASYQSDLLYNGVGNYRRWTARTSDLYYSDPHYTVAYAIGMRITRSQPNGTDIAPRDLIPLLRVQQQDFYPAIASVAANQASPPFSMAGGFVVLSGSVKAQADSSNSPITQLGQYVTVNAPMFDACAFPCVDQPSIRGWRVESKDHMLDTPHPGTVSTAVLGLPARVTVDGVSYRVVSGLVSSASGWTGHPAADAASLTGFALTGVGAVVDWREAPKYCSPRLGCGGWGGGIGFTLQQPGNMLWKLQPRPEIVGASAAAKDHGYVSTGQITTYALGIRLEP